MIIPALVHLGLLFAIGVPGDLVALTFFHGFACYGFGRAVFSALGMRGPGADGDGVLADPALRLVLAISTGAIVQAVLLGITLHWTTAPTPLIAVPRVAAIAGAVYGGVYAYRRIAARETAGDGRLDVRATLLRHGAEATLALVLSTCTILGFNNSPNPTLQRTPLAYGAAPTDVPSWGYQGDKGAHLVILPDQVVVEGLPSRSVGHRGVQLSLLPIVLEAGRYSAFDFVSVYKVVGFPVWLALLLLLRGFGRSLYGLTERQALGLAASTIFLGAISIPLWVWPATTYSGFVKPTLSTFHNSTQLYSVLVGGAGTLLLLEALHRLRARDPALPLGVFLLASSFFFKPSTFTIVAPFFVGYGVLWVRRLGVRRLAWLASLGVIPGGWVAYLRYQGIESPPLDPSFSPFLLYADRAAWRFPDFVVSTPGLLAGMILICSFLWVGLVTAPYARRVLAWRLEPESARFAIPLTIFAVGSTISLVVVENNDRQLFGNFAWFGHAAYLLAMPVFFWCFVHLEHVAYRALCTVALALHLAAGVQHLAYFTLEAKIVVPLEGPGVSSRGRPDLTPGALADSDRGIVGDGVSATGEDGGR